MAVGTYKNLTHLLSALGDVNTQSAIPGDTLVLDIDGTWKGGTGGTPTPVIDSVLTGFAATPGVIDSNDTILSAFGKAQGSITNLENVNVRATRFASISSGTSGTLTVPANNTVILDTFGGTTDAVISAISGGKPSFEPAIDASNNVIGTTFDTNGNYVLSGTPTAYPVALIYRTRCSFINYNEGSSDIVGDFTVEQDHNSLVNVQGGAANDYNHLTSTQVSALHAAVTISNASNSGVALSLTGQQLSATATDSNITHNSLAGVTGGTTGNRKHIAFFDTITLAKAASGTSESVIYIAEKEGIYNYCSNCSYAADDDLVLTTGDGGNTRWEMVQKMSRTQGDTGWINTDAATVSKISTTQARLSISTAAAIAIKGVRIAVPIGNYDVTVSGAPGPKFIYMQANLTLASRDDLWDFNTQVPVMIVYWTGTAITLGVQTELHGIRDTIWHAWAHKFLGTQYVSGLAFTGNKQADSVNNPGADDTVFNLWSTTGVIQDEDITATPGDGQWLQTLGSGLTSSNAAIFNHIYFNGTAITSVAAMADRAPFIHAGSNTTPQWNNAGTLTASDTGDYIVYHYFANPMVNGWSVFGRPHNAKYTSLAAAQGALPSQLIWTNYAELKHLYTAIFRVNTGWNNTHQCKLVDLQDWRNKAGSPVSAVAATSHNNLSSLQLAGAGVTYGHIDDQAQTIAGAKTFEAHPLSTDTDTPTANELIPVSKLGLVLAAATEKTTPVDADILGISDSAASGVLKKLTWANLKAALYSYIRTGTTSAPGTGYIGETVNLSSIDVTGTGSWVAGTSMGTLGAGIWVIFVKVSGTKNTTSGRFDVCLSSNNNADNTGILSETAYCAPYAVSGDYVVHIISFRVLANGATAMYPKAVGNVVVGFSGYATRIA